MGGGGQMVDRGRGFQGADEPPGGGCEGAEPREILNFWTQFARFGDFLYWKSLDLFPIKVFYFSFFLSLFFFSFFSFFFFFKLWYRPIWKWVIYPAHASLSSSPSNSTKVYVRPIQIQHPDSEAVLKVFLSCWLVHGKSMILANNTKKDSKLYISQLWKREGLTCLSHSLVLV